MGKKHEPKSAKRYFYESHAYVYGKIKLFNDLMNSDNPLTHEEMISMYTRYPDRYGFMESWVKSCDKEAKTKATKPEYNKD